MKRIPDPPEVNEARGLVLAARAHPDSEPAIGYSIDSLIDLTEKLLEELDARGDAIAYLRGGWQPAKDNGRRWTRSARRDGRTLNEKMEPRTQEVMYR